MPDARIAGLAEWGLDRVPGYRMDPATGLEDPTWRQDFKDWHAEMLAWRADTQLHCLSDPLFRSYVDTLCARDPAFFTALWLEIEEPRAMEYNVEGDDGPDDESFDRAELFDGADTESYETIYPYIPFAYQVEAVQTFARVVLGKKLRSRRHNVLWDKARGVGLTYAILAVMYWGWLYKRGLRGTILTEKWDKADRSHSLNTLFGKLDLFFKSTPDWIIPPGFKQKGEKEAHRVMGMLYNPLTGATISTEPTTVSSTRSSREGYIAIDECAFHEHLDETWATCLGTTFHVMGWSTASYQYGRQWATKLKEGRKDEAGTTTVVTLDWFENPHQDEAWLAEERARFVAAGLAEQFDVEHLRNPDAGYGTLVYFNQVQNCPDTDLWYDDSRPLNISVDPGVEDATAWVFWQTHFPGGKKRIRWIDSYERAKLPVDFHTHVLTGIEPKPARRGKPGEPDIPADTAYALWAEGFFGEREKYFMEWLRTVPAGNITLYGDPAMRSRDVAHNSFERLFAEGTLALREREGLPAIPVQVTLPWEIIYRRNKLNDRRTGLREALMFSEFSLTEGAQELKDAFASTRFQEATGKNTRPPGHIHDEFSHRVTAGEFGAIWETLSLTEAEVKPQTIAKPKRLTHGHKARSRYQQQKQSSLLGVA